jgi:hypothetical protein
MNLEEVDAVPEILIEPELVLQDSTGPRKRREARGLNRRNKFPLWDSAFSVS